MSTQQPIRIDIGNVIEARLGRKAWLVPGAVRRFVARLICQDKLNLLLEHNFPRRGSDFCRGVLADLGVRCNVHNIDRLGTDSRVIIVSNHPLGGLDGIAMMELLASRYRREPRFVVNDLLMAVEPLADNFVPVNKLGGQKRRNSRLMDIALASGDPMLIYPAGLVSRLRSDGSVADLKWNKMFVKKAIESRRNIIPVFFKAQNSMSFYRFARLRARLHIPFNLEMSLLPREVFRSQGSTFDIAVGNAIPWQDLAGQPAPLAADRIRNIVYNLENEITSSPHSQHIHLQYI